MYQVVYTDRSKEEVKAKDLSKEEAMNIARLARDNDWKASERGASYSVRYQNN